MLAERSVVIVIQVVEDPLDDQVENIKELFLLCGQGVAENFHGLEALIEIGGI